MCAIPTMYRDCSHAQSRYQERPTCKYKTSSTLCQALTLATEVLKKNVHSAVTLNPHFTHLHFSQPSLSTNRRYNGHFFAKCLLKKSPQLAVCVALLHF